MAHNRVRYREFGRISRHHLVPQQRLRDYYRSSLPMPRNILKLRRKRHDAWHDLFGNRTLNEIIKYLRIEKKKDICRYREESWEILFKKKTPKQAAKLLVRMRSMVRKQYAFTELDPTLRQMIFRLTKKTQNYALVEIQLGKRFLRKAA